MTFDEAITILQQAKGLHENGYLSKNSALYIKKLVGERLVETYKEDRTHYYVDDNCTIIREEH